MYFLRAENRETLLDALACAGLMTDPVTPCVAGPHHALDIIGAVLKPTGRTLIDDEGSEYAERVPVPGFFANYLPLDGKGLPDALQSLEIAPPEQPQRSFGITETKASDAVSLGQAPVLLEPAVPESVSDLQMRLALNARGLRNDVEAFVEKASPDLRDYWERALTVHRRHAFIETAAQALRVTDSQIDDIFRLAATL